MKHFSIAFKKGRLTILDQTMLPQKVRYLRIRSLRQAFTALQELKVRGAPLIGVFAAYSLSISLKDARARSKRVFLQKVNKNIAFLKASRPTAVNLFWALDRIKNQVAKNKAKSIAGIKKVIKDEAVRIHKQDIRLCRQIADTGLTLIRPKDSILTHCNTGFLATAGEGTALAIIYRAKRRYPAIKIYADESRPLLQGARLTKDKSDPYLRQHGLVSDEEKEDNQGDPWR